MRYKTSGKDSEKQTCLTFVINLRTYAGSTSRISFFALPASHCASKRRLVPLTTHDAPEGKHKAKIVDLN